MGPAVVPSAEIVRRVMQAETQSTIARLGVLARLPGNPVGIEIKQLGDAVAMSARYIPNIGFNRVVGLKAEQAGEVAGLATWYQDRGINGVFEIIPGYESEPVARALAAVGYAQTGFHPSLVAFPVRDAPERAPGVTLETVTAETLDTFLETHCKGWNIRDPQGFKANVSGWLAEPGWHLYLGRHEGRPAGTAMLHQHGPTAYCADAAADPAFRGHGVHAALLHHRLAEADRLGCDLVCSMANFLSTSLRNMVRAGFQVLHTKAIWSRL